jgi:hypothetical protein
MRVLRAGHNYELDCLQEPTIKASLDFYFDGEIPVGLDGHFKLNRL